MEQVPLSLRGNEPLIYVCHSHLTLAYTHVPLQSFLFWGGVCGRGGGGGGYVCINMYCMTTRSEWPSFTYDPAGCNDLLLAKAVSRRHALIIRQDRFSFSISLSLSLSPPSPPPPPPSPSLSLTRLVSLDSPPPQDNVFLFVYCPPSFPCYITFFLSFSPPPPSPPPLSQTCSVSLDPPPPPHSFVYCPPAFPVKSHSSSLSLPPPLLPPPLCLRHVRCRWTPPPPPPHSFVYCPPAFPC